MQDIPATTSWRHFSTHAMTAIVSFAAAAAVWFYAVPLEVVAYEAGPAQLDGELFGPGRLTASARTQLSPKSTGRIVAIHVNVGDRVNAGTALVSLQSDSVEALVRQARSEHGSNRAQLAAARSELARMKARLSNAEREHRRLARLAQLSPDAVAKEEVDAAVSATNVARAEHSAAQAQVRVAESTIAASQAAVSYQESLLADTELIAPFAGRVTQRLLSVGDTVGPGSGVLELVDERSIYVEARFDESVLALLAVDTPARVQFAGAASAAVPARVLRLGRAVDAETREFTAEIALQSLPEQWAIGQRIEVSVKVRFPAAITVAKQEVLWDELGAYVWVAPDGRLKRRRITVGLSSTHDVQIVSGLSAKEFVIRPASALRVGRRVRLDDRLG